MDHRRPVAIVFALALGLLSPGAHAQVYKCMDPRNQPVYQDKPCMAGTEVRNFEIDPATVSVIPMRPVPGTTTRVSVRLPKEAAHEPLTLPAALALTPGRAAQV